MKHIFFQLKSKISKNIQKLMKKPLFLEMFVGAFFSLVIIIVSVSGFEKEVFKEEFDSSEYSTETELIEDNEALYDDYIDWNELERGDALSEIRNSITQSSAINRPTSRPVTPTPSVTDMPLLEPTEVPILEDGEELEELPEVTLLPEITNTPEPEVILDPNGPVLVSDMDDHHISDSFTENLTLTGYDPSGEKLDDNHIHVFINNLPVYPHMTCNGSFSYRLDYTEGLNTIDVYVSDNIGRYKTYSYAVDYIAPEKHPAVISIDAASVGMGYMVTPTAIEVIEGKTVAEYVKEILSINSYSSFSKGSHATYYEFRGLYKSDLYSKYEPIIDDNVKKSILEKTDILTKSGHYKNFIKNGYFYTDSKWIFEINGEKHFDSMANYTLNEGDILRVRFTLHEGEDLDYLDNMYQPVFNTETPTTE